MYLTLGAIEGFERAVFGYGDIVLDEGRRHLDSFEAANGIIMFGKTADRRRQMDTGEANG